MKDERHETEEREKETGRVSGWMEGLQDCAADQHESKGGCRWAIAGAACF